MPAREQVRYEFGDAVHSCGVPEPRRLTRLHRRIVTRDGRSAPLDGIFPPVIPREEAPLAANA